MIQWNNKLIRINGGLCEYHEPPAPPAPSYPSDMDFIYLANDFDGSQVPNKATGTNAFGPYLTEGLAGIPRVTTEEEDTVIKNILLNQSV